MDIKSIFLAVATLLLSTSASAGLMINISDDGVGGTRWQLSGDTTALADAGGITGFWPTGITNMVDPSIVYFTSYSITSGSASLFTTTNGTMNVVDVGIAANYINEGDMLSPRVSGSVTFNVGDTLSWSGDFTTTMPLSILNTGIYTTRTILGSSLNDDLTINIGTPVSSVPVPSAAWLFGSGLIGLLGAAKRKRI